MFTGLIRDIGEIMGFSRKGDDVRLRISTKLPFESYDIAASVACSGICLTVIERGEGWFDVEASAETLSKTTLGSWEAGTKINLEPSLRMGDDLGGHLVFGHVDGQATLIDAREDGESWRLTFEVPAEAAKSIAPKGSITLDGISLTVNEVSGKTFGVNIIPYTWEHTTLSMREIGDKLQFEIDMLARYVARALEAQTQKGAA